MENDFIKPMDDIVKTDDHLHFTRLHLTELEMIVLKMLL